MKYFEKAANTEEAGANYNLGVMFLKGIWVKRDVKTCDQILYFRC